MKRIESVIDRIAQGKYFLFFWMAILVVSLAGIGPAAAYGSYMGFYWSFIGIFGALGGIWLERQLWKRALGYASPPLSPKTKRRLRRLWSISAGSLIIALLAHITGSPLLHVLFMLFGLICALIALLIHMHGRSL